MPRAASDAGDEPIDTLLVTGLPGSGRSTLLAVLAQDLPEGARFALCVHRHARAFSLETTPLPVSHAACAHYAEVYDFGSGCICCSPDGDLARLLAELQQLRGEARPTHLLIETTGVADPEPFMALFARSGACRLCAVACVLDLARVGPLLGNDASEASIASRGWAQLRAADVLVLNKSDQAGAPHGLALPNIATLGPCSWCAVRYSELLAAAQHRAAPAAAATQPPPPPPRLLALSHDATCETACLVLPRGGVRLEAALAMLQAMLDCGDALRVQGYLSFLPAALEADADCSFPPPLLRSCGLPAVTVEGLYRERLQVRAVEAATAPDAPLSVRQETAQDAAAADRGGCKIFLCGRGLHEPTLRAQLAQTAALGWDFVHDLESFPAAAQALAALDAATAATLAEKPFPAGPTTTGRGLAAERSAAEAFAQRLCERLAQPPLVPAPPLQTTLRGSAVLKWVDGRVSVYRVRDPLAVDQGLRLCVDGVNGTVEVLVAGSRVYCRALLE